METTFKFDSDVRECTILVNKLISLSFGKEKLFYLTKLMFRLQKSPLLQDEYFRKILTRKCNEFFDDPRLTPTLRRLIHNLI